MPSSLTNVMQTADVSTSAADFVAPGTANPGSTGKLADAGHVHPGSGAWSLGYEIVSATVSTGGGGLNLSGGPYEVHANVTLSAPTGKKVVGGGFDLLTGTWPTGQGHDGKVWGVALADATNATTNHGGVALYQNGPASDGSSWTFEAILTMDTYAYLNGWRSVTTEDVPASTVIANVYAICIAV